MKQKRKKIIIGIAVPVCLFLICIVVSLIPTDRKYENLQQALTEDKAFYDAEILDTLESNGVIDVFYLVDDMQLCNQFILIDNYCTVMDRVVFPKQQTSVNDYIIVYRNYKNKHCINITSTKANASAESVRDNQGSNFDFFQYNYPEQFSLSLSNWMVVFDELPENYSVTVDGETVTIN